MVLATTSSSIRPTASAYLFHGIPRSRTRSADSSGGSSASKSAWSLIPGALFIALGSKPAPDRRVTGAAFSGTTLGREATVLDYARRIADHESGHLGQVQRTIKD